MPLVLRVLAVPVVAVVVLAGSVLVVGQLLPGNVWVKFAVSAGFFVAAGAVLRRVAERTSPDLRLPFRLAVLLAALSLAGWYGWSLRGTEVQEALVPVPAAAAPQEPATAPERPAAAGEAPAAPAPAVQLLGSGRFRGIDHRASGGAELVRVDGEVRLQLRDLDVQPGPDYRLHLTPGETPDGGIELRGLKATRGNQGYEVPDGADLDRLDTVLIWCRAFSVPVAAAVLRDA
jgi:hypothetical protein